MFIPALIHNLSEAIGFCERYGIPYSIQEGKLDIPEPPESFFDKYSEMEKAAYNAGFITDHTNCFLTEAGYLLLTFSPYDGKLTEAAQKKIRSKGYDLRESGFDLYGYGTTTYVMAELVSPLDL